VSPTRPRRYTPPRAASAALLAGLTALAGWLVLRLAQPPHNSGSRLWGTLYLTVGVNSDERLDSGLRQRATNHLARFSRDFRELHPGVDFQLMTFPEEDLARQLQVRQQGGLGPDLLLVNARTAIELQRRKLVHSESFPAEILQQIEPDMLERVRLSDGSLAGLPVLQLPQLACFNRKRLPKGSPTNLDDLLRLSSSGVRVGLSAKPLYLIWTVGGLGATDALLAAEGSQPLSPEHKQGLERWLAWLQNASLQQSITFHERQDELAQKLARGELDWITCRSSNLSLLRESLGADLEVASLPGGRWGEPTPINRERVLVFGRNSSQGQRRIAREVARFSVNPLVQRNLTFTDMMLLPVNRFVPAPVASSAVLAAMVRSAEQSQQTSPLIQSLLSDKTDTAFSTVINRVLFGELTPRQAADILPTNLRQALQGSPP
jgi:arabinogalactan oligomer / maltooligosaccharide transport system substrate-binding protein